MAEFLIPEDDECTVELKDKSGAVVATVDITEVIELRVSAIDTADTNGTKDAWREIFLSEFEDKFGLKLSLTAMGLLLVQCGEMLQKLKKN